MKYIYNNFLWFWKLFFTLLSQLLLLLVQSQKGWLMTFFNVWFSLLFIIFFCCICAGDCLPFLNDCVCTVSTKKTVSWLFNDRPKWWLRLPYQAALIVQNKFMGNNNLLIFHFCSLVGTQHNKTERVELGLCL